MIWLKQSTAKVVSFGPFVSPTDGVTLQTGLVSAIDHASTGIMLSKNGGALAVRHASVTASTYDGYGNYLVTLDTTDTGTLGTLRIQFAAAASCLPVWLDCMVLPAMIYDSLIAGSDRLDANVTHVGDTSQTARDLGASVLLSVGTGTGQVNLSSGKVPATIAAGDLATDSITAAALKADAATEIGSACLTAFAGTVGALPVDDDGGALGLCPGNVKLYIDAATTTLYLFNGVYYPDATGSTANPQMYFDQTKWVVELTDGTMFNAVGQGVLQVWQGLTFTYVSGPSSTVTVATDCGNQNSQIQSGLATSSAVAAISTTLGAAGAGLTGIPKTGYKLASDGLDAPTSIGGSSAAFTNFKRGLMGVTAGTVGSASTTTSIVTSSLSPAATVADQFKGKIVTFASDTTTAALRGQSTDITASTSGGTLTVSALTTAPASGDIFTIS